MRNTLETAAICTAFAVVTGAGLSALAFVTSTVLAPIAALAQEHTQIFSFAGAVIG